MDRPLADRQHGVELLMVALAGIGEELGDLGASALPKTPAGQAKIIGQIVQLTEDGRAIAFALAALARRPRLL